MVDGIKVKVWMKIDVDGSSKTKGVSILLGSRIKTVG